MEQFDTLRGYSIAVILLAIVAIPASAVIPTRKIQPLIRSIAALVGAGAGAIVFFLFTFIAGWDQYFAAKSSGRIPVEYRGRHQAAARLIETLGEMDLSAIGLVFGIVGLILLGVAYVNFRAFRGGDRAGMNLSH